MPGQSLHGAVCEYIDALTAGGAPHGTIRQYRGVLLKLCAAFPGRQIGSIKPADLGTFLYGPGGVLVGRAASTGTVKRAALRGLWRYAAVMGWCMEVSVPSPVVRPRKPSQAPPTRLTRGQLQHMLSSASDPVLRAVLAVAMNTGLRISDIRKIKLADLDLQGFGIAVQVMKTGTADVWPISSDLDAELRRYLTWYGMPLVDTDAYLFPGRRKISESYGHEPVLLPDRPVSMQWLYNGLRSTYVACGISVEKGEAWHVIRRSVARLYFDDRRADVSHDHALRETAALLGHANVATTEKYLGMQAERVARDAAMRGRPFIGGVSITGVITPESRGAAG